VGTIINGKCTGNQPTSIQPSVPMELLPIIPSRPPFIENSNKRPSPAASGFVTEHGQAFAMKMGDKFSNKPKTSAAVISDVKPVRTGAFLPLVVGGVNVDKPGDFPWMASCLIINLNMPSHHAIISLL
jgi:hypothetical protein